jgi:hypothetical protein
MGGAFFSGTTSSFRSEAVMERRKRKTAAVADLPAVSRQDDGTRRPVPNNKLDGRAIRHRTVDTLGLMLRAGTITTDMFAAAQSFQVWFTIAHFDAVRCSSLLRLSGRGPVAELTDAQVDARRHVDAALDVLGGPGSPAGSCVWHVIGLQHSIRAWAMRQGWSGRPIGEKQAQGIVIAALGVLARHYECARA